MVLQELHTSGLLLSFVCDEETQEILKHIPVKNYNLKHENILGDAKEALVYLKNNRSPKILIVDISKSELPINDMSAISEICEPGVHVIVIGTRNDVGVFRELLKLGIRDYLVKPLLTNHVVRSIENVILNKAESQSMASFSKFGKVVSFLGVRGGIGTTTLATNCSWIMSEKHARRISLIDPDLCLGSVAEFLDLELSSSRLHELLESPERLDLSMIERFMIKYSPHLMVMCGQSPLDAPVQLTPEIFDMLIKPMVESFHYTVFDLPRSFDTGTNTLVLGHSNIVVLISDLSIPGIRNGHRYLELLNRYRTSDQQIFLVVNRHHEYQAGEIELKEFEEALQRKVDLILPFDDQEPLQALTKGVPVVKQEKTAFTKGIEQLANKIMGRHIEKDAHSQTGFFSFLGRSRSYLSRFQR